MKIRNFFDKEGLSLAGMILFVALFAILLGVISGNWIIRLIADPSPPSIDEPSEERILDRDEPSSFAIVAESEQIIENETEQTPIEQPPLIERELAPTGAYVVQAGVFNSLENARNLKRQLEEYDFEVWITDSSPYRVYLGAFDNREAANALRDKVSEKGFDVFISN